MSTKKSKRIKEFWTKYESKIVLFFWVFLVATISFQLGILQGQKWQQDPLIVEKVPGSQIFAVKDVLGESSENDSKKIISDDKKSVSLEKSGECMFVGSKNSDKYHRMDCRWADQIKSENIVCFKSEEDAKSKGYVPASCMK